MEKQKKEISYMEIIKKSWQITWSNKILWWFGLLATFIGGSGSLNFPIPSEKNNEAGKKISEFMSNYPEIIIAGIIIFTILILILIVIGILGRGALIKSIKKADKGESIGFKSGIKEGKKYFGRIFAIGLINFLFIIIPLFIIAIPIIFLFINKLFLIGILFSILGFLIIICIGFLVSFLQNYGCLYGVLGELSAWQSIENAYFLLRKNIGPSFVMFLIFMVIGMIFMMGVFILIIPLGLIFLLIGGILYLIFKSIGIAIAVSLAVLTFILIFLFLRAVFETFSQTIWILFFHEIADNKIKEEIVLEEIKAETNPAPEVIN